MMPFRFPNLILAGLALGGAAWSSPVAVAGDPIKLTIGPEISVLPGGLQPFMFQSDRGTLVVQAEMPNPPGYVPPARNAYPGYPGTVRSTDQGRTWERWQPDPNQGIGPIFEGNVASLRDGTILLFEWIGDGPRPGGYFQGNVWESRDDWKTMRGPTASQIHLPQAKGGFDDGGKPYGGVDVHRTLIELPDGDLLATAYCWFKGDDTPSTYMPTMMKFRSIVLRSKDRGLNWNLVGTIAVDPTMGEEGYNEPVMVRISQGRHRGRLIAVMRVGTNKVLTDLNSNLLRQAESDDEGRTWTKPHALAFEGVDPDLIEMQNGVLVAGFGWRTPEATHKRDSGPRRIGPKHGNYLAFSLDQGASWIHVTQVTHEPTTSYVTVREVRPGRLLLVYDKGWWDTPDRAIAGRIIDVELQK